MPDPLLLGLSHFPMFRLPDERWKWLFQRMLSDPGVPEGLRDPKAWPEGLRREWSDDEGLAAARAHRAELIESFRKVREELDRYDPEVILIWGDDQYENFREEAVPPFSVLAYESLTVEPWKVPPDQAANAPPNPWGEAADTAMEIRFDRPAAKDLTARLLAKGFDITYAYKPLHTELGHAFLNTVLYLDYDRRGFPWKIIPFPVNCYGSLVISQHGFPVGLSQTPDAEKLDPPSPAPWRCFDLGRAVAQAVKETGKRVAIVASASWSHAFLTRKHYFLYPDLEADRKLYDDLVAGRYESWRERTLDEIEDAGQQEILNWVCLAGALHELGLKPRFSAFHESYMFNSPKAFLAAGGTA